MKDNKTRPTVEKMMEDDVAMNGIKDVYPSVDYEWLEVFHKQHQKMFHIVPHSLMCLIIVGLVPLDYISQLVNQKFGVTKKDNRINDMWIIKGSVASVTKVLRIMSLDQKQLKRLKS